MKRHTTLPAALIVVLLLTGCSADDAARSQLAKTAGDAASAARSAGLTIGLQLGDRLVPGFTDTSLGDAADNLADQAKSLTTLTANGGIQAERDSILATVRSAQDAVSQAQDSTAAGKDRPATLDPLRRQLDHLAQTLDAQSKRLEQQGEQR